MEINVTAQQFAWAFEYPDRGVVSDILYLPVGKQVILKMQSRDVIHSFWVPEFRIKQDVVPGRTTEYRITPTLIGDYKVRCAELCGTSHAYMEGNLRVVSQEEYDAWMAAREEEALAAAQTPEGRGKTLSTQNGCLGCHTVDGAAGTGPTWFNLYGKQEQLADGTAVIVDDAYIHESIVDPQAKLVAGFESVIMPKFDLTDEQIADIIAYIKTLK
jgi:cytochrome c oxidase subunit 2